MSDKPDECREIKGKTNRLIAWIDRLLLVEGLILFGGEWFGVEWFGKHYGGAWGVAVDIAGSTVLYLSYCWWRRKGIFRDRKG